MRVRNHWIIQLIQSDYKYISKALCGKNKYFTGVMGTDEQYITFDRLNLNFLYTTRKKNVRNKRYAVNANQRIVITVRSVVYTE